jgi:hypothetical protein
MLTTRGGGDYLTIQEAIDAVVQGDSIQVAPGNYQEQLVLENLMDISIIGSGVGITFLDSPDTLLQSVDLIGYPQYPHVLIFESENISFSNLTLDGRGQGGNNYPFHGFGYFHSGGTITDVHITHYREDPLGYQLHGNGIFAADFSGAGHDLNLENLQIDDFQKSGILLHGEGLKSTSSNVHVVGQGPVIAPSQNGWQVSGLAELVASGCSVSDVTVQNSAFVATGILGLSNTKLTLTNCDFDQCQSGLYSIENTTVYTGGTVTNPTLTGIIGKSYQPVSSLDEPTAEPIVIGSDLTTADGSLDIYLTDLNIVGIDAGNSWGVGILSGKLIHVEMENVDISHFNIGMVVYEDTGEVTGTARNCTFYDNTGLGIYADTAVDFDARFNDWGHSTGPFQPVTNPNGMGDEVFGTVRYIPFNGGSGLIITPDNPGPVACGEPVLFTVSYVAGSETPDLFMYNITVRGGAGLERPISPVSLNPWGGTELFLHYDLGDSSLTVTGSTIGGDPHPLVGPGTFDLFTFEVSAALDSGGFVFLEDVTLRDPDNVDIPTSVDVYELVADCLPPAAVTDITAITHHNRVEVTWNHSGLGVDHYEVFSGLWHDGAHVSVHPEYDDIVGNTVPTRPADHPDIIDNVLGEWGHVGNVSALTIDQVWSDSSKRGVFYFEVFAVDAVGNTSAVAAANDHATNYWLGDEYALDGFVTVLDITVLGASFGESEGDTYYNNLCDYGPTDDSGPTGIPLTDNVIGFEDLMIVAMNFGVVSDVSKSSEMISNAVRLDWVQAGEGLYALRLVEGEGVKGIRVRASLPGDSFTAVAGQLLDAQDEMTFLKNVGNNLDLSVAVMGQGNGFDGSGDLFLIRSSTEITASDLDIIVRGHDNSEIQVSLNESVGTVVPRIFELKANHPNPFNPMTKISFSLPEPQDVLLKVYGVDGRCVATLVNETRSEGLHEVLWTGRDDTGQTVSSGTYFYQIEAGPYSQVRKMSLLK